jgi:hypothetical protein
MYDCLMVTGALGTAIGRRYRILAANKRQTVPTWLPITQRHSPISTRSSGRCHHQ